MTEITIHQNITPSKLKDLYRDYINQQISEEVTLILPVQITKYTFGLVADLLKFVITLNRKALIKVLKINVESDELDSIYDQEYAYPIISLLWNTSKFVDKENNDIKEILRDKQNEFFFKMNSLARVKGNKYLLVNTDHLSKSKGLVRLLENSNGFNDDEKQITKNIKRILLNYILTFNKNNKEEIEDIYSDIGAIIYELAKNTYEWGKSDANLIEMPSSIRGVYFRFHKNNIDKLLKDYENTALETFFKHSYILENCLNEQKNIYYLEILVFDSGIGFIDKFTQRENQGDIEIIKRCLIKNQTSSTSNLKSKKGIGLDRILNILDFKGFVRISTDKYCVYRDLIKDNYEPIAVNNLEQLKLDDWYNNDFKTNDVSKSQGSYISILYPFKNSK